MPVKGPENTVFDGFLELKGGVNSGWRPSQIPNDSLSFAWNCTVRGGYLTHRPGKLVIPFRFKDSVIAKRVLSGNFQGASMYQPDSGTAYLVASISGRLFKFPLPENGESSQVTEITISAGTVTQADFVVPLQTQSVQVTVLSSQNISPNAPIQIGLDNYVVVSVDSATLITVANVDGTQGDTIPSGTVVTFWDVNPALRNQVWMEQAEKWLIVQDGQSLPVFWDGAVAKRSNPAIGQITAGKMMAYHRGRLAKVNPDGYTYSIGDVVYGSSGTAATKFRDSVLYVTENTFLAGGGFFTVPGNYGEITFMRGMAALDTGLGQGPLIIGAEQAVFSVNLPATRADWQSITDPIQSVAHIAKGGSGQNNSVNVNGDMFYRSADGVRTLIQATREFLTSWGNTPASREMNRVVPYDDQTLLKYGSAVFFDNRMLMTFSPSYSARGVFHRGTLVLDCDVMGSMRDKQAAVWEGIWMGINTLQIVAGAVNKKDRCFEFSVNGLGTLELYEQTTDAIVDQNNFPIKWLWETADFFRRSQTFHELDMKRLLNGELYITDLRGQAEFRVWWKPDQHPCWTYWTSFIECAKEKECSPSGTCLDTTLYQPQYRHRIPFGQPPDTCDEVSNKKLREGRTFQLRVQVIGSCVVRGVRLMAQTIKEPTNPDMSGNCIEYDTVEPA